MTIVHHGLEPSSSSDLLVARGLIKRYPGGKQGTIRALDGVDLTMRRGEIVALVGESGSGKSTLVSLIAGLERPTAGRIMIAGRETTALSPAEMRAVRRHVQVVFQDPYESLNPRQTIAQIVAEPLIVHGVTRGHRQVRERVVQALQEVGLAPADFFLDRRPGELSGGQRQRVAIAAALVAGPDLVLADEPVSMLDVSVRAEILNLLGRLREQHGVAVLLVTHDLATAVAIADRVAVMFLGRIVELGPTPEVVARPAHPYTRALIEANPTPDPRRRTATTASPLLNADAAVVPAGCRFQPRCRFALPICLETDPALRPVVAANSSSPSPDQPEERWAACLFAEQISEQSRSADVE